MKRIFFLAAGAALSASLAATVLATSAVAEREGDPWSLTVRRHPERARTQADRGSAERDEC